MLVYGARLSDACGGTLQYRTLVAEAIEIIIELDRPLKRDLGESLSRQPPVLHPWTTFNFSFRLCSAMIDACLCDDRRVSVLQA